MEPVNKPLEKEEFDSNRACEFCKSQEGQIRMVGNFLVELSEVTVDDNIKLACQSCKIKVLNFRKAKEKNRRNKSFFKSLFNLGF
ncbi:MAG: hypothetical protein BalsKO_32420 [Balneolaceae bacterium]